MKKKRNVYITAILIPLLAGGLSALITKDNMDTYETIVKPALSPPGWLFPVVWSILYILMGISAARIYLASGKRLEELRIFGAQLLVNVIWAPLFFNLRAFFISLIWIFLLWVLVICMIVRFRRYDKPAAYLQIPYALWVTFATYLNFAIFLLNS